MILDNEKQYDASIQHSEYERIFEWRKWAKEIPPLHFPTEWSVQIIPPFGNAIVRFYINNKVSVYLDCYEMLGCFGRPYWEVYPYDGDIFRCKMNETEELLDAITKALAEVDDATV